MVLELGTYANEHKRCIPLTWEQVCDDTVEQWQIVGEEFRDIDVTKTTQEQHFFIVVWVLPLQVA